jgi:hypothetical protein
MDDVSVFLTNELKINFYWGLKHPAVSIVLCETISTETIKQFLSHYKFSFLKGGKFFLKRLIKRVFENKSNSKFIWNNSFWDNNVIHKMTSKIQYVNGIHILTIEQRLSTFQNKRRMKDILCYKKKISENIELGSPIYIKGNSLNALGGDFPANSLYQIDGSRRLMANILNQKQKLDIWLISPKNK